MKKTAKRYKRVYIEITNTCNLSCGFCPKTSRVPEFMDIGLFERIISEVKEHADYLFFHVMGEPLMHPDIDRFLDICDRNNCRVNITTNGKLIGRVRHKLVSKRALKKINFSMNIFNEKTSNKSVDEYLDDIFEVTDLIRKRADFIACFRFWNNENAGCMTLAQARWDNNKNEYITGKIKEFYKTSFSVDNIRGSAKWGKIADNVYVQYEHWFDWPDMSLPDLGTEGFCLGLRQHGAVLVDGTVVPCCLDREGTIALGNIREDSFLEIVNGKKARDIYDGFSNRTVVEPLCRRCSYRKRFDLNSS